MTLNYFDIRNSQEITKWCQGKGFFFSISSKRIEHGHLTKNDISTYIRTYGLTVLCTSITNFYYKYKVTENTEVCKRMRQKIGLLYLFIFSTRHTNLISIKCYNRIRWMGTKNEIETRFKASSIAGRL